MVIAAAGALSVATAASATAAIWGQGAPARADGSADMTQETNTHGAIAYRAVADGAVMRQVTAPEALVVPRLAVTDQIAGPIAEDRKSTRLNSSHPSISYAVFCLKKKKNEKQQNR